MYDIRQFRPTLYALLILGFVSYAVASQSPGLCVLALSATLINAWLYKKDRFVPMPRLFANVITIGFAGWMVLRVREGGPPIFAIGEFLVLLQLVKLYETRANRDLAQLLILSLLLVVAAAISTGSLLFGILFVLYLFLSLYCCLLFHLKTETDYAKAVMGLDEKNINPATLRQDQRFLGRSMRRLTALVSTSAIAVAAVVFLFFPRGSGAGIIGNLAFRPSQAMTGFSDQVSFQDVARISQNDSEVATVKITRGTGEPFGGPGEIIYLRGNAPDAYVSDPNDNDRWKWIRLQQKSQSGDPGLASQRGLEISLNPTPLGEDEYVQEIQLRPTGSRVIFGMPGITRITPGRELRLTFGRQDEVLQALEPITGDLPYTIRSTGKIGSGTNVRDLQVERRLARLVAAEDRAPQKYDIPKEIQQFALRNEVSGADGAGEARTKLRTTTDLDEQIARSIEIYLQHNFTYTLDLTDASRVAGKDPLVQFLYDFKRGHCEYFAGAMALMCQSLNMQARVVVGFKCDEFNVVGGYYQVRQSHAHAWVEVLTLNGWQLFDPTASREFDNGNKHVGLWRRLTNFVDYLDYAWGNAVVNYDADARTSVMQNIDGTLTNTAVHASGFLSSFQKDWLNLSNFWSFSSNLIAGLVMAGAIAAFIALMIFLLERIRLRRRAKRIGLDQLSTSDQKRLARQLAFYDELVRRLDRHRIKRPAYMTPMEFSRSVGFLPNETYLAILRLTRVFYRVRYGGYALQSAQQARLMRVVERVDLAIDPQRV